MDDTCTVLPVDLVDSFYQHLNSVDPDIQFTMEEKDGQLLEFPIEASGRVCGLIGPNMSTFQQTI